MGVFISLDTIIKQKTLVSIIDAHCGFGLESVTNDLPKALTKFNELGKEIKVIILYNRTPEDDIDSTRFNRILKEISELYDTVYIISDSDAKKINVYGSPTRHYYNNEGILVEIKGSLSTVERLFEEINKVFDSH